MEYWSTEAPDKLKDVGFKSEISTVIAIWFADGRCRGARVKGGD